MFVFVADTVEIIYGAMCGDLREHAVDDAVNIKLAGERFRTFRVITVYFKHH